MKSTINSPLKQIKMYNIKSILILSLLMHLSQFISAQQMSAESIQQAITEKKWSFSLSLGAALIGPGAALSREMNEIGFGDNPPDFDFFGIFTIKNNKEYPEVKKSAAWDMEGRFNLSNHSALSLTLGKSHHYIVNGYRYKGYQSIEGGGLDYRLTIVHDVWFVSADYIFRYAPGYGGIAVGPVIAMHRVSEGASSGSGVKTSTLKPGFHVGADIPLFQKKSWFMAFGLNYTWLPSTTLGPNTEQYRKTTNDAFPGAKSSVNHSDKIPLATLQMSLTTGWRF
jgi:hypothetical protein